METGRSLRVWAETPSADRLSIAERETLVGQPLPPAPPSPDTHSLQVLSHVWTQATLPRSSATL